jgi:hypothetical protein
MLRLIYPALAAAALHAALLGAYVAGYGGDVSALVCTGEQRPVGFPYEHIRTRIGTDGYDGQWYYAIARAPLARHGRDHIDMPPVRQLRIFYPAICWALSGGGHPVVLLWVMPVVNVLAIAGLAWVGALIAVRYGCNSWWGMLLPLAVNAGMPALRDLTDTVGIFTLAALMTAWVLRAPWWTLALSGAAAALSREQNVPAVVIVLACAGYQRQWLSCAGLVAALALWCGWVAYLWRLYGEKPFLPAQGHYEAIFRGLLTGLLHGSDTVGDALCHFLSLALLAFQIALAVDLLRRRQADPAIRLLALYVGTLALVGWPSLYIEVWGFARVYPGLPLAVWMGCVQSHRLWPLPLLSAYVVVQWVMVVPAL